MEDLYNHDLLIWDEISMSSERLFHLVNFINQKLKESNHAFGGMQMILVGDFWQLKPITNAIDAENPLYKSILSNAVFPHRYKLTDGLRQGEAENHFRPNSHGKMRREITVFDNKVPPLHIYFKHLAVEVHNGDILASLDGSQVMFNSIDTGKAKSLDKTITAVLCLKYGCRVMLLYNVNDQLKNGYCGKFVGVCDDCLLVVFLFFVSSH